MKFLTAEKVSTALAGTGFYNKRDTALRIDPDKIVSVSVAVDSNMSVEPKVVELNSYSLRHDENMRDKNTRFDEFWKAVLRYLK